MSANVATGGKAIGKPSKAMSTVKPASSNPGGKTTVAASPPVRSTISTSGAKAFPSSSNPSGTTATPSAGGRATTAVGNTANPTITTTTSSTANSAEKGGMTFVNQYGKWNQSEIEKYFEFLHQGEAGDQLSSKGLEKLVKELHIDWMSYEMLVLMWKLRATSRCVSRGEWNVTMYDNSITQPLQLRTKLSEWVGEVRKNAESFTEMYNFLYDFFRDDSPRWLEAEKAVVAWKVLIPTAPLLNQWCYWVKEVQKQEISRDVWQQLWVFFSCGEELEKYNPDGKWPTVLDDFVEWHKRGSVGMDRPKELKEENKS